MMSQSYFIVSWPHPHLLTDLGPPCPCHTCSVSLLRILSHPLIVARFSPLLRLSVTNQVSFLTRACKLSCSLTTPFAQSRGALLCLTEWASRYILIRRRVSKAKEKLIQFKEYVCMAREEQKS